MIHLSLIPSTERNRYERSSLSSLGSGPTHTGYLSDTKHATFHRSSKHRVKGRVYDVSNAFVKQEIRNWWRFRSFFSNVRVFFFSLEDGLSLFFVFLFGFSALIFVL